MTTRAGIAPPGFRLPDATHVGTVRLQVSDVERSLEYYTGVLGLRLLAREGRAAALGVPESEVPLVELHAGARAVPGGGKPGLYHFAILLPDRAALGRFLAHLGARGVRAGMSDHLVSEALYLQDPDNLGIEVYADRPRAGWQVLDTGELAMTTEPLDVAAVLAAGEGRRWTGMPEGTMMGHVHLHVGDIAQGSAFYHDALGLDRMVERYPGALFLAAGGYHHHLGTNVWARGTAAPAADEPQLLEWELVVPGDGDVERAAASLGSHGVSVERDTLRPGFVVADPWGTRVRVRSSR